jgi:tetratricopeptide (TPR) repeat protein
MCLKRFVPRLKVFVFMGLAVSSLALTSDHALAYTRLTPQWYASLAQDEATKGQALFKTGDYLKAYQALTQAIAYVPTGTMTATWYNSLGLNYVAMGHLGLAAASFQTAIRLHPSNVVYYENLVRTYISDEKATERLKALSDYLSYNPVHGEAWFLLGLLYSALGDENGTQAAWEQHLLLTPRSAFKTKICTESPVTCQRVDKFKK